MCPAAIALEERFVPRFAAEPPQEDLPYGRWEQRLSEELLAAVAQLDTEGVPAMAQVGEMLASSTPSEAAGAALRADEIRPSVDRAAVMAVAPETDGRFFKVPKVIER